MSVTTKTVKATAISIRLDYNKTLLMPVTDANLKLARALVEAEIYDDNYIDGERVFFRVKGAQPVATIEQVSYTTETYADYIAGNNDCPVSEAAE